MLNKKANPFLSGCIFLFFLSLTLDSLAQGFLEMPDTSEVPEYEEDSMLLDLDVPPVSERDPDPQAGPRLNVSEFKLQGLVEYPELGITRSGLVKRVEAIRFDLMKEDQVTGSGYTLDELGEVSDLIAEIESKTGEQHVGPLEVQKLVFLIREQRRKRGVTLGMIETVADTITRYYRERGFILAKAYIPEQKVRDGVVTLTLLLGELGEVSVENRKRISEKLIVKVLKGDMHKPVTSWNIEEALYLVNDIPGVSAQGFFSPGDQVGDTKLTVNLLEEKWYSGNIRFDNHGSENTSENRVYTDLLIHNPLGVGDELYLAVLNTFDPDNSTYEAIRYSSMLGNPRWRAEVGYSTNDFVSRDIGQGNNLFKGESDVADVSLAYHFKRSRVKNYSMDLSYTDVATELDSGATTEQNTQKLTAGFNFDLLNQKKRQLYVGRVSLSSAETESDGFSGGKGSHVIFNYDFTMLSFLNFPFTKNETRLVFKSFGQYAGEGVSNLNQLSLTGPQAVRAFGVNGFQADNAVYVGADWIFGFPKFGGATLFGQPISKVFQPYVFVDVAYGELPPFEGSGGLVTAAGPFNDTATGQLADVGVGLKFNHSNITANLLAASPILDDVADVKDKTPATGVYFELQYGF